MDKNTVMKQVLVEATNSMHRGESPFAAGIVIADDVYLYSNCSKSTGNPNMHAEIVAINEFCKKNNYSMLKGAEIYSNCEPCIMCLHAIYNVGIKKIYYGATIKDAIQYGSGDLNTDIEVQISQYGMNIAIEKCVLRDEAIDLFAECIKLYGRL